MNFTQIYMASPDWLKLAWIVLPCATIYGMARVWGRVRMVATPPAKMQDTAWIETGRENRPVTDILPPSRAISACDANV